MKVLVTGGNGFVGSALIDLLIEKGVGLTAAVRSGKGSFPSGVNVFDICSIDDRQDWSLALSRVDVVVHVAAKVHVMSGASGDSLCDFRAVNVAGTINLARQAVEHGVRRFVFISSAKVNGESTLPGQPFRADDEAEPEGGYARSKYEAENLLHKLADESGMELVVIRPPLVYGKGVKGNFNSLLRAVSKGMPLPFGAIHNKRSLVSLTNLVDFIETCIRVPEAAGETFLVSDGDDVSTPELLRRMYAAQNRTPILIPVPVIFFFLAGKLLRKSEVVDRLCGSFQLDIEKNKTLLGWEPSQSMVKEFERLF